MKQNPSSAKKIVAITGGSGFVGTYVRELLSANDFAIINYDLNEPQKINPGEKYVKCDITDAIKLNALS